MRCTVPILALPILAPPIVVLPILALALAGCQGLWPFGPTAIGISADGDVARDAALDLALDLPARPRDAGVELGLAEAGVDGPVADAAGDTAVADAAGDTAVADAAGDTAVTTEVKQLTLKMPAKTFSVPEPRDLTRCDARLSFTVDVSKLSSSKPDQLYLEVGLREVGAPDFNPSGAGGWLILIPVGYLDTDPAKLDLDDKIHLQAKAGEGEKAYDVDPSGTVVAPFGTFDSTGIWYDRDGVDASGCASPPVSGINYCSGALYRVVIDFRAISATLGTMVATVNGVATGFFTGGWHAGPADIEPAGKSFVAEMAALQLFVTLTGQGSGEAKISDLTLVACPPL